MNRRRLAVTGSAVVVIVAVAIIGVGTFAAGGDQPIDSDAAAPTSAPRRSSTTSTSTTSTTAAPTTTVAPATTAAPTTAPPTTVPVTAPPPPAPVVAAPPAPPPPPPPPAPVTVLVAGDSLGFTAAYPLPTWDQLPPSIAWVTMRARIGCGVLASAGFTAIDTQAEGALGNCGGQEADELAGLSERPTWMVFFSGAWEHLAWVAPDGRQLPARSPELRAELVGRLLHRSRTAGQSGVRTAFVAWVCPNGVLPHRRGDYAHWYNNILREVASMVPGAIVIEPTDRVCVGGDAGGEPTAEKDAAFTDHHPVDKRWIWQEWIGPRLEAAR